MPAAIFVALIILLLFAINPGAWEATIKNYKAFQDSIFSVFEPINKTTEPALKNVTQNISLQQPRVAYP